MNVFWITVSWILLLLAIAGIALFFICAAVLDSRVKKKPRPCERTIEA